MIPIRELDAETASGIEYVLCDIDDTLTNRGKLTGKAYGAMWRLARAGIHVIPVTGRPAGWCDLIVREWPVKAVVGENGAFVYYAEKNAYKTFTHPDVAGLEVRGRLDRIRQACMEAVPGCRPARDQPFRVYDLAIDFNEDVHLGLSDARKIKEIGLSMGAQAKISSIHVNIWFGRYDKLKTSRLFLENVLHERHLQNSSIFFGDSPNDEPMFEFFPKSCGVANVARFAAGMDHLPAYIASGEGGYGFAEAADRLLCLRGDAAVLSENA